MNTPLSVSGENSSYNCVSGTPAYHSARKAPISIPMNTPLKITTSLEKRLEDGNLILKYTVENISETTVHLFESIRMPYLILQEDGSLLVLHGVNPPDPMINYYSIEIPVTRPLEAREILHFEATLNPFTQANHYETYPKPTPLSGEKKVVVQVAWGTEPILKEELNDMNINLVLAWQNLVSSDPIQVEF